MANPYSDLPDHAFWRRSVSSIMPFQLDPLAGSKFVIEKSDRVASAGSCFAQHIARNLHASGYNYFVAEQKPANMRDDAPDAESYKIFSACFGNIYTVRQLLQLFDRAFGYFTPSLTSWKRGDGKYVDPFRPGIQDEGFASEEALRDDREAHLKCVRSMFMELDVFVFTLGLTEAWRTCSDGAVLPIAPGISGGSWDRDEYEFVNLDIDAVRQDLRDFHRKLCEINPSARMILTVSPVPLVATYEPRHVLVSTVYSKSVLRVAAEALSSENDNVMYFPSYEIVTSGHGAARYFERDLRSVNDKGVRHVMRIFFKHLTEGKAAAGGPKSLDYTQEFVNNAAIVCDEEKIDQMQRRS